MRGFPQKYHTSRLFLFEGERENENNNTHTLSLSEKETPPTDDAAVSSYCGGHSHFARDMDVGRFF